MNTIRTPLQHRIAKEFFLDLTNTTTVSKKIYPSLKSKNAGAVSNCLTQWRDKEYITEGRILKNKKNKKTGEEYTQAIKAYKLKIDFYFDYAKEKLGISPEEKLEKVEWMLNLSENKDSDLHKQSIKETLGELQEKEFNNIEKEILEYIFSFKEMRKIACKEKDLFIGINRVLERIFLYKTIFDVEDPLATYFRKGFFVKNKKYVGDYENYRVLFKKFNGISGDYFSKLRKKIELVTDFSEEDYFRFIADSPLRKYQYMESYMKFGYTEKQKQERLNLWCYIYFYDKIPPEIEPN